MFKRFRFGSQDSITNPNPNIIRLAKITNPNPNIRDSEEKIRIRIRIFVTTLSPTVLKDPLVFWLMADGRDKVVNAV